MYVHKKILGDKRKMSSTLEIMRMGEQIAELKEKLTEATEILKKYHDECPKKYSFEDIDDMAEKFLEEE